MTDLDSRLQALEREFRNCESLMVDPEVVGDRQRYIDVTRRYKELEPVVEVANQLWTTEGDIEAAKELLDISDADDVAEFRADIARGESRLAELNEEIRLLLIPKDPNADRNVIVEIRGAEGGEEANLWARDLVEMYRAWAAEMGWKCELLSSSPSDLGGVTEAALRIAGEGVWARMKFEAGPHRVQRVPSTESQGRIHTSSATVAVLPEAEEVDIEISPNDLEIDVYRSSGPGGQSVNTTDSAVRITHKPTGLVVSMQDQKSQLQNKAKGLAVLRSRLLSAEQDRAAQEAGEAKKAQIGGGGRGEKIRTYNFKENRVTDHRIGLTIYNLDRVLAGGLEEVSDSLITDERARLLAESTS